MYLIANTSYKDIMVGYAKKIIHVLLAGTMAMSLQLNKIGRASCRERV